MHRRNWLLKLALVVMSVALAAFGVLGWAYKARLFDALPSQSWALLDPLWPLYGVGAIACLAAQIVAACAAVNFTRLATAAPVWRVLAMAFYGVAVFFAAYSADMGAQVVMQSAHRAAYEAREAEREALRGEITTLTATIERERQRLPLDSGAVVAERQRAALAVFEAATAPAMIRLPEAQRELASKPSLPREPHVDPLTALAVFLIFLAWAVLEPWGYSLAERGRQVATEARSETSPQPSANVHWLRRSAATALLGWLAHFATGAPARASEPVAPPQEAPEPVSIAQWQDAKSVAFSMRGRFEVPEIAAKVGRDKSTIYRWFRERDRQQEKAA